MRWRMQAKRTRDELAFHRDQFIDDLIARGLSRREAERRAFLEFGNVATIEEASRDVRGRVLETLLQDIRYAVRALRRQPVFAAVALLSLAVAIGANTAIFSVVNAVLLRPLPVQRPGELVQITRVNDSGHPASVSYPLYQHFRSQLQSIAGSFATQVGQETVAIDGQEEFAAVERVSGSYFNVLGIVPAAGRLLEPADDAVAAPSAAVVMSNRYWERRFGRNPGVIGRVIAIRDRPFTIVGVMPATFQSVRVGSTPDLVAPLELMIRDEQRSEPTSNFLKFVARLKPGVSVEQADAEARGQYRAFLEPLAARVPLERREGFLRQRAAAFRSPDGVNPFRDDLAEPLVIVMGAVGFLLLLSCVNLAGLLLARAAARTREVSIRLAIGAGRWRLVRQFLTESLVLAAAGAALGVGLATWLGPRLVSLFVNGRDVELSIAPDWRVLLFTLGVAATACVLSGLVPALRASRLDINPALKTVRAEGPTRLGRVLVVAQLAISMILIVAATLFVGTLVGLYRVDLGFDGRGVVAISLRSARPYPPQRVIGVQHDVLESLARLPGVVSVSAAQVLPISGVEWSPSIRVVGDSMHPGEAETEFNVVAPAYFSTLGTHLLTGRDFNAGDSADAPPVAIVNASFGRYFFGDASPLGRRVTYGKVTYEVVGLAADAKYEELRETPRRTMYISASQLLTAQPASYKYLVRTEAGDPTRLVPAVTQAITGVDRGLHVETTMTYATLIDRSIPAERILATIGGLFGIAAILIAGIGLFGVLAFQVSRRTSELGVRLVLGATPRTMVRMVIADLLWMLAPGLALGAAGASAIAGLAHQIVFGVTPTDPRVFAFAASVLTIAALVAAWWPARRAARVDPMIALRAD